MTWQADRPLVAGAALMIATLTGIATAAIGASTFHALGAIAYIAAAMVVLLAPGALAVQVVGGQLLAAGVFLGADRPGLLVLVPLVASVIVTAELLALAGRLDTPFRQQVGGALRGTGTAALIGAVVSGIVVLAGGLPGPTGIAAIAFGSAVCALLALLLTQSRA